MKDETEQKERLSPHLADTAWQFENLQCQNMFAKG